MSTLVAPVRSTAARASTDQVNEELVCVLAVEHPGNAYQVKHFYSANVSQSGSTPDPRLVIWPIADRRPFCQHAAPIDTHAALPYVAVYRMAATVAPYARPETIRGQHCTAGALGWPGHNESRLCYVDARMAVH
jgi:hypothetical protein